MKLVIYYAMVMICHQGDVGECAYRTVHSRPLNIFKDASACEVAAGAADVDYLRQMYPKATQAEIYGNLLSRDHIHRAECVRVEIPAQ